MLDALENIDIDTQIIDNNKSGLVVVTFTLNQRL